MVIIGKISWIRVTSCCRQEVTSLHDALQCCIPCVLGYCDSVWCISDAFLFQLDLLGSLGHLNLKHVVQSFSQLFPDTILGLEDSKDQRILFWFFRCEVSPNNGDSLL